MTEESGQTLPRQWTMLQAIPRSPLKVTAAELESRLLDDGFQVSRRTIERDLHALSAQFPLVLDDRSRPYGWSWARDANFEFMPRLTTSQAVVVLLAQTHLRDLLPRSMQKELTPIFDSAQRTLAHSGWKDWHQRTAVMPMGVALIPPRLSTDALATVQSALAHRRCLTAKYRTKGSNHAKPFTIHPLGVLSRGTVLYLVCTLFDYDDVLQLALHRLSDVVETGVPAREPKGFDFRQWVAAHAQEINSHGPIRLVARFKKAAAEHLRETPLSRDQQWRDLEGADSAEVTATVDDNEFLRWWLLAFGAQVAVLEPLDLRKWIADEATRMVENNQIT